VTRGPANDRLAVFEVDRRGSLDFRRAAWKSSKKFFNFNLTTRAYVSRLLTFDSALSGRRGFDCETVDLHYR
jgi:hypothetical protein